MELKMSSSIEIVSTKLSDKGDIMGKIWQGKYSVETVQTGKENEKSRYEPFNLFTSSFLEELNNWKVSVRLPVGNTPIIVHR